jgi:nitrite reductase/ring-hydroxylating ferredoxin subunit
MGGPLVNGDIEDICGSSAGSSGSSSSSSSSNQAASAAPSSSSSSSGVVGKREAVVCPWHSYRIYLDSGEGVYLNTNREWQCKGARQRSHPVTVVTQGPEADRGVFVSIQTAESGGGKLESDTYQTAHKLQQQQQQRGGTGGGGGGSSGGSSSGNRASNSFMSGGASGGGGRSGQILNPQANYGARR